MEIDDQRQMIRCQPRQRRSHDACVLNGESAAIVHLIERRQGQKSGETAETSDRCRRLLETVVREMMFAQRITPVVVIAGNQSRKMAKL